MQLNKDLTTTQNELTTQSVFGLRNEIKNSLCLYNKNAYYPPDSNITVSNFEFNKRLINKIGEFIGDDFDWSNVLIAGGLISGLIDSKFYHYDYAQSDVDVFIYGQTRTIVTNKIQEIYDYLCTRVDGYCYSFVYTPNTPIINIIMPGECSFQIIGTLFKTKMEVLESFDMTHCQIGYDGNGVVFTKEFINAINSRVTVITKRSIHAYRLVKAYNRGYSIADPEYCYIKNIFHEYTTGVDNACNFPRNNNGYYDVHNLQNIIDELANNKIVQQNLTKNYIPPKHDIYTKEIVDEEMKKIGELYAGEDKYIFVNDCNYSLSIDNIEYLIKFVRMPFLC